MALHTFKIIEYKNKLLFLFIISKSLYSYMVSITITNNKLNVYIDNKMVICNIPHLSMHIIPFNFQLNILLHTLLYR